MNDIKRIVLEVQGLSKIYGKDDTRVHALRQVNFILHEGEITVIMGSSGSGKSTLLQILGGLDTPTEGKVLMDGMEAGSFRNDTAATQYRREKIGFVFQAFNLIAALTAEENVSLPLVLANRPFQEIRERTDEMLRLVGLYERRSHKPSQLSGGQQQRVALARALVTKPSIVLADEPTGNLDSRTSEEMLELLRTSRDHLRQSIVIVTHDPKVALYGDRILFFHDGQIVNQIRNDGKEPTRISDLLEQLHNLPVRSQAI